MRIRRAVQRGELRAIKTESGYAFDTEDLDAFKASLVTASATPVNVTVPAPTGTTSAPPARPAPIPAWLVAAAEQYDLTQSIEADVREEDTREHAELLDLGQPLGTAPSPWSTPGWPYSAVSPMDGSATRVAELERELEVMRTAWRAARCCAIANDEAVTAVIATVGQGAELASVVVQAVANALSNLDDAQLWDTNVVQNVARAAGTQAAHWLRAQRMPTDSRDDLARMRERRRRH